MRTLALLAVLSTPVLAQPSRTACALAPEIEKEYLALPSMSDLSRSWAERYAPRRALAQKYPADWPLQVMLQGPILQFATAREWDLALAHYRSLPDRLLGQLLEARLFSSLRRKKSREMLDDVLAQAADSPWTHLVTLEWAANRRSGDPALAEQEFEQFRRRCPDSVLAFQYLRSVRDPQRLRGHVAALRSAIEARKKRGLDEADVELFRTAWTWERITYGDNRIEEFRRAVRADADFLREHLNCDSWPWVYEVSFAYSEILKDGGPVTAIEDETLLHAPNGQAAWWIAQARWKEKNPPPPQSQTAPNQPMSPGDVATEEAYDARRVAFMVTLIERFWGKPYAAFEAYSLLDAPSLPAGSFERLSDFVLSNAELFPDQGSSSPPPPMRVAQAYLDHKVRLERVPALVQQGLEQIENEEKYRRDSDAFGPRAAYDPVLDTERRAREILVQHAIVIGQRERALALLGELRRELDASKPADTTGPVGRSWRSHRLTYLMLARQAGLDVSIVEELTSNPEEPVRYPVANFEARDLFGKTWSLADLQGKVTYVLLWRTGCGGSCRAVLDGVQQLYERWKNRTDRSVLTISQDDNPAIAQSFMKENGYSFPMVYGAEIAEKFGVPGWPQALLIDPQGRRLQRHAPRASDATIGYIEELADKIAVTK